MVVGEIPEGVDLLVVGGGPGGYAAALRGAQLGREVTLVDRDGDDGIGGVCLRVGCIPSKALIELADLTHRAGALARDGLARGELVADMAAFQRHKRDLVQRLTGGVRRLLDAAGVQTLGGVLRFTRPDQAVIETPDGHSRFVQFRDVIIATGSRPIALEALPHDGVRILDSTDALALERVPPSVAVVGSGYIGVELGTALAKLGSKVTLVEKAGRLLPDLDPALTRPVARRFTDLGIDLLVDTLALNHNGSSLTVESNGDKYDVPADVVIVAVGRRPNTDAIGLDRLGVTPTPDGLLPVGPDRVLRPHVAAIGDITPGPALAHKAYGEAVVAAEALSGQRSAFEPSAIPAVIFSDPEIATVGLGLAEAAETAAIRLPVAANPRAQISQAPRGHLHLVSDPDTGLLLGAHLAGPHASELISEAVLALELNATAEDLAETIHPHPTLSEHFQEAARALLLRPLNTPSHR